MRFIAVPRAIAGLAMAFVLFGLSTAPVAAQDQNQVVDEIVAVVGDRIVLRSEVDGLALGLVQQNQIPYSEDLWVNALQQLINQRVLAIQARKDTTLIVSEEQVEQTLQQRVDQMSSQVGGETKLEDLYGKSVVQIKDELREEFRDRLLAEQFQQKKLQNIRITPSEVQAWFSQFPTDSLPTLPDLVRVAHIVRYPDITPEARRLAMEVITAIRDSVVTERATLEDYAVRFSDDPGSIQNGGRYESSRLSELAPEFAAVAARSPIGEISQPFETQFGLHILRVNNRMGEVVDFNHILIAFDEGKSDPTEALEILAVVRDSLVNHNMPFELMAKRHSEEDFTSIRGGRVVEPSTFSRDLPLEALDLSWRRTINDLEEGEISEPAEVQLLDGQTAYHILTLQKRIPSHKLGIETDYERIQEIALQEKQQRVLNEWVSELRQDVYVDLRGRAQDLAVAGSAN